MRSLCSVFWVAALLAGIDLVTPRVVQSAANITVINDDGSGEGFNDPTAASPVGGNTGTTIGQQRVIAFQHAANIWAATITSSVVIRVSATFDPLSCDQNSGVLGAAGPTTAHRDFPAARIPNTWYVQALANSLFGGDLAASDDDIEASFNANVGTSGCLDAIGWYYGLDGNSPANQIDFVSVVLHELGHGLGFLSLVDLSTGAKFLGRDDAFMRSLEDHSTGKLFPQMTDVERANANVSGGNLHWTGANVIAGAGNLTNGRDPSGHVEMYAPNPVEPVSSVSHFNTDVTPDELMEPFYTGPNHDADLTSRLLADLGWNTATVDTVAPQKVANLTVGTTGLTSITLTWTAPGDDFNTGTAAGYDLRLSNTKISESNWASATQVNGEPVPGVAGTAENLTVSGLLCGTVHYFALKTVDDAANVSVLSNVATGKTSVCPTLTVTPLLLPNAEVGLPYNATFGITGGVAPYTIQVTKGLPAPAGLSINSPTVSGTPTEAKTWRFTIYVTDSIGSKTTKSLTVKILKLVTIITTSASTGTVGRTYLTSLRASGGKTAYNWTLVGGTLPNGLILDSATGRINGIPTTAGSSDLTFQVTDALGGSALKTLTFVIN